MGKALSERWLNRISYSGGVESSVVRVAFASFASQKMSPAFAKAVFASVRPQLREAPATFRA